jgi:hypothetical protein
MFLFSASLPGHFGNWCDAVIARLAQAALGSVASTGANTAEELAAELIKSNGDHLYVGARHPNRWLREVLVGGDRNFVVALEDPRRVASELVYEHRLEVSAASRLAACSCASLYRLAAAPRALVVGSETAHSNPAAAVASIAHHLDLRIDPMGVASLVADLEAVGLAPRADSARAPISALPEPAAATIEGALAPYAASFRGGNFPPIIWTRELFLDDNHRPASRPIDLAGPIRYLIYGPYISLPPGSWAAEVVLGFSEDAVEMGYRIEVWAESLLASLQIQPAAAGLQRINLNFTLDEANDHLVEVRVVNERVAAGGRLVLGHATMRLVTDLSSAVAESLSAELGLSQTELL